MALTVGEMLLKLMAMPDDALVNIVGNDGVGAYADAISVNEEMGTIDISVEALTA